MSILLIADNPIGSSLRGSESNDAIIHAELGCDFQTCQEFNEKPQVADKYIVSNFASLSHDSQEILMARGNYSITHHDFLITPCRDPGAFPGFKVPPEHLINQEFIKNATVNYVQSKLQLHIFQLNEIEGNFDNLAGNLWTRASLEMMVKFGENPKNGRAAIMDDPYKGPEEAVDFCRVNQIPFDILPKMGYFDFLEKLSTYTAFILKNRVVETLNRVLLEAKIMNILPLTTQYCGAVHEDLWNYNGEELADKLNEKRDEILKKLAN